MWASRGQSTTSDELAHLTGGYTFNHWNDYRLHPENGLLPQRWQALPLSLGTAPIFPSLDSTDWREANVWKLGHHFFYEAGNDHAPLLRQARAMNSFFGAALTLLVFFWSRKIWGTVGAMSSAIFCAFCPTLLAHSGLATSDLAAAFFLLASTGAYWRHLHDHRPQWWWLSLTAFGLACVAKYTAVLLLPIFGLLVLVRALSPQPLMLAGRSLLRRRAKWIGLIISLSTHGLAAMITIWAFCGFRYSAFNPTLPAGDFSLPWDFVLSFGGRPAQVIAFFRDALHSITEESNCLRSPDCINLCDAK